MNTMIKTGVICSVCGKEIEREENSFSTGYGYNDKKEPICFYCCGELDKKQLRESGLLYGYIVKDQTGYKFCNWPNSFSVRVWNIRKSYHNFAGKDGRTDFWFEFEGKRYHGVNIGDNECAKVKVLKHHK